MPKHEVPQGFMLIFQPCWCTEYPSIKWLSDNEFSPFSLDQPMDSPHLALVLDHACSGTPVSSVDWAEKGAPRQNEAEERAYRAYRSRFLQLYVIFNAKNSRPSYGTFFCELFDAMTTWRCGTRGTPKLHCSRYLMAIDCPWFRRNRSCQIDM